MVTDTVTFTYDENGNQVTKTTDTEIWQYGFDENNMLIIVSAEMQNVFITNIYIPDGRQVRKTVNGIELNYFYDGADVLTEQDALAEIIVRYTNNLDIDDVISAKRGDTTEWYHKDAIGSVASLTFSNEDIAVEYRYDPFGIIIKQSNMNDPNEVTFTGRRYDRESGLYYYRSRYYCQVIGRFTRNDDYLGNIFQPASLNPYIYCNNNPLQSTDPLGTSCCNAWGAVETCWPFFFWDDYLYSINDGSDIYTTGWWVYSSTYKRDYYLAIYSYHYQEVKYKPCIDPPGGDAEIVSWDGPLFGSAAKWRLYDLYEKSYGIWNHKGVGVAALYSPQDAFQCPAGVPF
jgi:RHS repeat-associated protein